MNRPWSIKSKLPANSIALFWILFVLFSINSGDLSGQIEQPSLSGPPSADQNLIEGVIPVRVVGGHLVALVDMSANDSTEEFAMLIDFQANYHAAIVPNAAKRLKIEDGEGEVEFEFTGGYRRKNEAIDIEEYPGPHKPDDITKYFVSEMDERKIAGAIGSKFFSKYRVTIDLNAKQMKLEKPKKIDRFENTKGDIVISPIRYQYGSTFLPILLPNQKEAEFVLGSNFHDTYVDKKLADRMQKPAGDIGRVLFKTEVQRAEIDLAKYVAFRPGKFVKKSTSVAIVSGTKLLEHFRMTIDWPNKYAILTQSRSAKFPYQDLAFFKAENEGTSQAVLNYLNQYPEERLSKPAAVLAVNRLIQENGSHQKIYLAIEMVVNLTEKQRRSVTCLEYFEPLKNLPKSIKLLQQVGDLGLKHSSKAIDGFTAYDIHVQLGLLSQENDELKRAWEHLLSATFGRPDDFRAVVALGKVYEKQGRFRRAYSRYKKVGTYARLPNPNDEFLPADVLTKCIAEAKKGMKRLKEKVPDKDK